MPFGASNEVCSATILVPQIPPLKHAIVPYLLLLPLKTDQPFQPLV